jgi:hypothetical protein
VSPVFIPARLDDNPHLDRDAYRSTLMHLPETTRRQLLEGDWGAFEGMAFPDWDPAVHVVAAFTPPSGWERFESFDHGTTNPSCLLGFAADYDGNLFVFDSYYAPGLPSVHARAIRARRAVWYPEGAWPVCYADPEMWATKGETKWGTPASDITDYEELGIGGFVRANNIRSAGRTRVAELLRPRRDRFFPRWHPRHVERGAPQLFIADCCVELIEQVAAAPLLPLDSGRPQAGEIIDPTWESQHGHAVAALRYGCMSRPDASPEPPPVDDPRARIHQRQIDADQEPPPLSRFET